jgi:predicted nucleic acid-binding protein
VIVVDASALAKYLLREEGWEEVSRYVRTMRPLYSLEHVLKEVTNAVWRDASTRKVVTSKLQCVSTVW